VTGEQRDEVEARVHAILARAHTAEEYAEYFEAQMRAGLFEARRYRGYGRKLLAGRRVFRRPRMILLAVVLVPCALVAYATAGVRPVALAGANEVTAVNTASGQLVAVTPLPGPPGAVSAADGSVWVADPAAGQVLRLNGETGAEVAQVPVGGQPGPMASGGGAIWVAGTRGTVARIDPATNSETQAVTMPWAHPGAIAFGAGGVWVADPAIPELAEIDPATGSVERLLPVDLQPSAIAATGQAIWVAGYDTGTVEKLAPGSGRVLARIRVGGAPAALAVGAGALWVASTVNATVSRIDLATSAVTAIIPVGQGPAALVADPGSVWVADQVSGTISRIDPRTDQVTAVVSVTGAPTALAITGSSIWTGTRKTAITTAEGYGRLAPARGRGEQPEGAGPFDGLGAAAGAELGVQMALVRLDRVHRQVQLAGDLPRGQIGRQVVQYPALAVGQGLAVALRWGRAGGRVAERVVGDRRQQERRRHPDPVGAGQVRKIRGLANRCCHLNAPSPGWCPLTSTVALPGGPSRP
jgi:YVTN family beta-propeller protein